ncbi:MAG: sulfate respiration complex protein HmcE [Thermodesulfobacteriota bacterium]
MYEIVTGPLAWLSFLIFSIGILVRIVLYIKGLDWKLDRVTYSVNTAYGIKGAVRSILFWIVPFGARSWRTKPLFTVMVFTFHIGLLVTPVFLIGHNLLLQERWGITLWTLSENTADLLTLIVIISAVFLALRRIALPEVRILTTAYDYLLLLIAVAPFITGFLAHRQVTDYQFWLILHILSGEIWLIAIPFTKLSHIVMFFLSRAQIGMDFGIKRGGMKGRGMVW